MQYAVITNPVSGRMSIDQKRAALAPVLDLLEAEIHGLDTTSAVEFGQCARDLAGTCEVLVAAGGDGTLSDIINTVDTSNTAVAYLPLGTGNAMRLALEYRGSLADVARRIRDGEVRAFDLIDCDGRKRAFMASVGLEGAALRFRNEYLARGVAGFRAYAQGVVQAYLKNRRGTRATVVVDETTVETGKLLSLMIVKQPYYGFGMKVVPRARFDDRQLHILRFDAGLARFAVGMATAFAGGNRAGDYTTGRRVSVALARAAALQTGGDLAWDADRFEFAVLPRALRIRC